MNLHLAEIARTVAPGAHAVLVLDGAGWHVGQDLAVPDNISLITLPPYAPELNPVENVWPPVARSGGGGMLRLSVKVIKAGVTLERMRPGKP